MMCGSASGFRNTACICAPLAASAPPAITAVSTRGTRSFHSTAPVAHEIPPPPTSRSIRRRQVKTIPHDVRIGQRIPEHRLHLRPAGRQRPSGEKRRQHPGHPQFPQQGTGRKGDAAAADQEVEQQQRKQSNDRKVPHYSSGRNIGSQAGSMMGFWSKYFMREAGTYFLSTTRRNMYSSNHSSVMMMLPW